MDNNNDNNNDNNIKYSKYEYFNNASLMIYYNL